MICNIRSTVFILIKAVFIHTQGLKYTLASAAELINEINPWAHLNAGATVKFNQW